MRCISKEIHLDDNNDARHREPYLIEIELCLFLSFTMLREQDLKNVMNRYVYNLYRTSLTIGRYFGKMPIEDNKSSFWPFLKWYGRKWTKAILAFLSKY